MKWKFKYGNSSYILIILTCKAALAEARQQQVTAQEREIIKKLKEVSTIPMCSGCDKIPID